MNASHDQFYEAMLARDYRFDGKFFVGVRTTGVYCRPICPARPKRENVEFFSSSLEAEKVGYRPCLRCRPETAPLSPAWYGKSAVVQRSLRAIIDLGLSELSEEQFAERFGVTARHLRRLFVREIGKTPKQFYQEQRLNLSRKMIVETRRPITEIAFEAGFRSLRRFNTAFKSRFSKTPLEIRKTGRLGIKTSSDTSLKLSYRPPFNWKSILEYLRRHQIDHIEEIGSETYIRYFSTQKGMGRVLVENEALKSCLVAHFDLFDCGQLYGLIQNIRRLFDLDADPILISNQFEKSDLLRNLDQRSPGGRAPGCWNGFESAVAIILGQLVSSEQARRLVRQLVLHYGEAHRWHDKEVYVFPVAEKLARVSFGRISTTKKRKQTLRILSREVATGRISLSPHQDIRKLREQLLAIPGIGSWTVEIIGMRCLSDPDSCPRTDLILKRVQQLEPGLDFQRTRPWRAYAVHLLWEAYAGFPIKKRAIKMRLYFKRVPSLIGELQVYANDTAVVGLVMADEVKKDLGRKLYAITGEENEVLIKAEEELKAFFAGELKRFSVPVEVSGTDFQKAVWKTLRTIGYGQLRTYADVAGIMARPRAVRAVGRAIGSNPVPIIIPCHRVIGSNASLTGFGGGLAAKQTLLEIEGHTITNLKIRKDG